jgi:hypothetical protein
MVPLTAVPTEFAGRVIVAKLGSAGILAELRGVSRVYPTLLGEPHVWVEATEFADARELITADVDAPFAASDDEGADDGAPPSAAGWPRAVLVIVALLVLVSFGYATRSCSASPVTTTSHTR